MIVHLIKLLQIEGIVGFEELPFLATWAFIVENTVQLGSF
jgi:hypothetical protein